MASELNLDAARSQCVEVRGGTAPIGFGRRDHAHAASGVGEGAREFDTGEPGTHHGDGGVRVGGQLVAQPGRALLGGDVVQPGRRARGRADGIDERVVGEPSAGGELDEAVIDQGDGVDHEGRVRVEDRAVVADRVRTPTAGYGVQPDPFDERRLRRDERDAAAAEPIGGHDSGVPAADDERGHVVPPDAVDVRLSR